MAKTERYPRPLGTTFLALNYRKSQDEDDKSKLKKHIINAYVSAGFSLNGKSYNLDQISIILGISIDETMKYFNEVSQSLGSLLAPQNIQETLRTAMTLSLTWALQDKGRMEKQISILAKSQGDTYRPFISSELNKALKLGLEANKNVMEYFKSLTSTNPTTVQIFNNASQGSGDKAITPFEAQKIIQESGSYIPLQQNKEELNQLYLEHHLDELPELNNESNSKAINSTLANSTQIQETLNIDSGTLGNLTDEILSVPTQKPQSLQTLQLQSSTAIPRVPKRALKPSRKHGHTDFFERRGYPVSDADILP